MGSKKFKLIGSSYLLKSFISVRELQYKVEGDNTIAIREVVERPEAAAIVLYDKSIDKVILVSQFRPPTADKGHPDMLELPAGIMETGETPENCIIRETLEETGYQISDPKHIISIFVSPGYSSELIHIFYKEVSESDFKQKGGGIKSEHEHLTIEMYSQDECLAAIKNGNIMDAKTVVGLQMVLG